MTGLPADFEATLDDLRNKGILDESGDELRTRVHLQLQQIQKTEGIDTKDLGPLDWAGDLLNSLQTAVYREICDPAKKELKTEYAAHLTRALTPQGIAAVAAIVLDVARAMNPALAVSSLGIYVAIWLLKIGLNYWCSLPVPDAVKRQR